MHMYGKLLRWRTAVEAKHGRHAVAVGVIGIAIAAVYGVVIGTFLEFLESRLF
jgi:hypothetical protein